MNLKRILWLVVLALVHVPVVAGAADVDTFDCETPYPFWWRYDGPRADIVAKDWEIEPMGEVFRVKFSLVNQGSAAVAGGESFTITHAAVDPSGYGDPTSPAPPLGARALLGAEAMVRGTLPALLPGERAVVEAYARGFSINANHISLQQMTLAVGE